MNDIYNSLSDGAKEVYQELLNGFFLGRTMGPDHTGRAWLEPQVGNDGGRQVVASVAAELINSGLLEVFENVHDGDYVLWRIK